MRIIGVRVRLVVLTGLLTAGHAFAGDSVCYGTVANGKLHAGVQLPLSGTNFSAYSALGHSLGRTYLHKRIADLVVAAYAHVQATDNQTKYVYGETGWESGGRIRPHRTHQNGLSIDFMVPVKNAAGDSVPLPTSVSNKFGYGIDFDKTGKFDQYTIDVDAMSRHLIALKDEAKQRGIGISLVIFDPDHMPMLFAAKGAEPLKDLPFMKKQAWVRHDEHYHIDFSIPCLVHDRP
jgi:penicillin-insensitive murein DD-endopeptidase